MFGVALGNIVRGVPLDERHAFAGSLFDLFDPFSLAVGALAVAGAFMHGSVYLILKTEDELRDRAHRLAWVGFFAFALLYVVVSSLALFEVPHATANLERWPWAWSIVVLNALAVLNIPRSLHYDRPAWAFVSTSCAIAALTIMVALTLFPYLVPSLGTPGGLDIYEAASSRETLALMGIVALIGMPLVATYTAIVYWVFRGKVTLDPHSY